MAVPWMTGFYSKDLILEVAYGQYEFSGHAAYWLNYSFSKNFLACFTNIQVVPLTVQFPRINLYPSTTVYNRECKSIVIHGTCVGSTVGYNRYNKILRHITAISSKI